MDADFKTATAHSPQSFSYAQPMGSAQSAPAGKPGMFDSTKWRDLWAAVLFYAHLGLLALFTAYSFYRVSANNLTEPSGKSKGLAQVGYIVGLGAGLSALLAAVLSALGLAAMRRWPRPIIHAAMLSNTVVLGVCTVLVALAGNPVGALVLLICTALSLVFYFIFRSRIAFSAVILANVVECFAAYPHMLTASLVTVGADTAYMMWLSATVAAASILTQVHAEANAAGWIMLYCTFSMLWTHQVMNNTLQTTIAGVYATWYFLAGTGRMVASPVLGAARRALTYSFGSICFGSLIVAVIQMLRVLLKSAAGDRKSIPGAIADCLLKIVEDLVRYFNYFAYTQIAIYGKPYTQAARDTMRMLKSHGIDAIVNDNFVSTATTMLSLAIALICAAACYGVSYLVISDDMMPFLVALIAFFVAICVSFIVYQIVDTGATTTFVCLAEDSGAIRASRPAFFEAISRAYPNVALQP